jgi:hypothetical protein
MRDFTQWLNLACELNVQHPKKLSKALLEIDRQRYYWVYQL